MCGLENYAALFCGGLFSFLFNCSLYMCICDTVGCLIPVLDSYERVVAWPPAGLCRSIWVGAGLVDLMASLTVVLWNVRGLNSPIKRSLMFQFLKTYSPHICVIQENLLVGKRTKPTETLGGP